nr:MAG TPA: hypothetical protein [Caudoviricetes sp.]
MSCPSVKTLKASEVQAFIHSKRYGRSTKHETQKTVAT